MLESRDKLWNRTETYISNKMADQNYMQLCTVHRLRMWIERSPLAHKCLIIYMTNDLNEIIRGFEITRKAARYWDEDMQQSLFAAVCMLFLIHGCIDPPKNMRSLLFRVLGLLDTKDPMSVHGHVEYLLGELHKAEMDQERNLLLLVLGLMRANACRGLTISVCLLWSIIGHLLSIDIKMHRYREFKELAQALVPVAEFSLIEMNTNQLDQLHLLLETINQLMVLVLLSNNEGLKQIGYPDHFFKMRRSDVDSMLNWATSILYQNPYNVQDFMQIDNELMALVKILNRIRRELPELVELEKQPKLWQVSTDTYSDLDD